MPQLYRCSDYRFRFHCASIPFRPVLLAKTVVPAGASSEMLDTVPVRSMRGLGGKLGEAVVSWSNAETASDLKVFVLVVCIFLRGRCRIGRAKLIES